MFKKKKIGGKGGLKEIIQIQDGFRKSQKGKSIFTISLGIVSVFFIVLVGFGFTSQISNIDFNIDSLLSGAGFKLNLEEVKTNTAIKKSEDGKTNIVIIGRGGQENDAPELTDSIMVVSLNYDKNTVSLFSLPRDLYVEYPTGGAGKVNETYFRGMGKEKSPEQGIKNLKEMLGKITGEEMHYFVNLDFEGFRKIIDTLGGIDIDVPEAIVDTTYPGPNHSYQTFKIEAGPQVLSGEMALKYARSRHSTSDFDRSIRQQLIVKGIREKVLSLNLIANPSKIKNMYNIIKEHILTDFDLSQMIQLAMYIKDIPKENIVSSNLNDSCFYGSATCAKGGFLYVPQRADFGGMSVLLPNGATGGNPSNYDELSKYTNLVFNYPEICKENLRINIFNATKIGGLANEVAEGLKKYGFNIPDQKSIGNVSGESYPKSKILYSAKGVNGEDLKKPVTVEALELFIFGGSENVMSLPKYSKNTDVQIEIIIGDDYKFLNY